MPGRLSPDGKWVLYTSTESARPEVYLAPFPGPGGKLQISAAHALFPLPGQDYDVSPDGQRFLVTVPGGEALSETIRVVQNWTAGLKR